MPILGVVLFAVIGGVVGMLGGGGSILGVPVLVYLLGFAPKPAIGVSLVVLCVTSLGGMLVHAKGGRVDFKSGILFGIASMVSAYSAGVVAAHIRGEWLMVLFSALMIVTALAMLRPKKGGRGAPSPGASTARGSRPVVIVFVALGVGAITGLVGAGGGFLVVPALVLFASMEMRVAVGTSLLVIALNSGAGALGHVTHLELDWGLTALYSGAALGGSLAGATLAGRVPQQLLRKGFGGLVLLTGLAMLGMQFRWIFGPN